jgi:hypothetical protein
MTIDDILQTLNEHGQDAASDYNDGENVMGYFGWSVETSARILVITFEPDDGERQVVAFQLTEVTT